MFRRISIAGIALSAVSIMMLSGCAKTNYLSIYNPAPVDRMGCVAEIDASALGNQFEKGGFVITDVEGREVPYQITYDNKLLVETDVKAGDRVKLKVKAGTPQAYDTVCVGQIRLDFQDDFTWENDRGGYRLYGPAYRKDGGNVGGYDVWTKSVPYPILSKRYFDQFQRGISYHKDQGTGMDAYTVGRTLGAGMNALVADGEIAYPCAYEKCEILDNGPLRTTARITCYPETIGRDNGVVEVRVITLDKGSWLNRTTVNYNGLSGDMPMVTGIVVHKQNKNGYYIDPSCRFISYADVTDSPSAGNGVIYIGVVNVEQPDSSTLQPMEPNVGPAVGQVVNTTTYRKGSPYTYYWGAGWSKGGVICAQQWDKYLEDFHTLLKYPLVVEVK